MMELHFERMAQVIAIAAVGSEDKGISRFYLKSGDVQICFSEYVKSQVHLNVVRGLYGRSLQEYVEALRFLQGKTSNVEQATAVLRYFYKDLAYFLINNGDDIELNVKVDTDLFSLPRVKFDPVKMGEELRTEFEQLRANEFKGVENWRYAPVLDYIRDADDLEAKCKSYAFAQILQEESKAQNIRLIESW